VATSDQDNVTVTHDRQTLGKNCDLTSFLRPLRAKWSSIGLFAKNRGNFATFCASTLRRRRVPQAQCEVFVWVFFLSRNAFRKLSDSLKTTLALAMFILLLLFCISTNASMFSFHLNILTPCLFQLLHFPLLSLPSSLLLITYFFHIYCYIVFIFARL
jgi:hypothetical protein